MPTYKIQIKETVVETILLQTEESLQEIISLLNSCNNQNEVRKELILRDILHDDTEVESYSVAVEESRKEEEVMDDYTVIYKDEAGVVKAFKTTCSKQALKNQIAENIGSNSIQFVFGKTELKSLV